MKEQILELEKQIEKLKDIATTNQNILENQEELSPLEIEKMRASQETIASISKYNIIEEYSRFKKQNLWIRTGYAGTLVVLAIGVAFMSKGYFDYQNAHEQITLIRHQKEILEKEKLTFQEQIAGLNKKNKILEQEIATLQSVPKAQETVHTPPPIQKENVPTPPTQTPPQKVENKTCTTTTTLNINVRENPGLEEKIITFIPSGSEITVLGQKSVEERTWMQIQYQGNTGWMSSIGVENFNFNDCK